MILTIGGLYIQGIGEIVMTSITVLERQIHSFLYVAEVQMSFQSGVYLQTPFARITEKDWGSIDYSIPYPMAYTV